MPTQPSLFALDEVDVALEQRCQRYSRLPRQAQSVVRGFFAATRDSGGRDPAMPAWAAAAGVGRTRLYELLQEHRGEIAAAITEAEQVLCRNEARWGAYALILAGKQIYEQLMDGRLHRSELTGTDLAVMRDCLAISGIYSPKVAAVAATFGPAGGAAAAGVAGGDAPAELVALLSGLGGMGRRTEGGGGGAAAGDNCTQGTAGQGVTEISAAVFEAFPRPIEAGPEPETGRLAG